MLIDTLLIPLTIVVLLIAALIDVRTREVPNWLNYGFIAAALGIRTIFAVDYGWTVLFSGLLGLTVFVALAYLFYYTNQWGGGDSKLLMGMGASLGIAYPWTSESLQIVWFFLLVLLLGAVWGIGWMIIVAFRSGHRFQVRWKMTISNWKTLHWVLLIVTILSAFGTWFWHFLWPFIVFPLGVFYLFLFVDVVEKSCFITAQKPSKVVEGDWLAEDIVIGGKTILRKTTLQRNDLTTIKLFAKEKKITEVLIKEGVPFTPGFLFAYVLMTLGSSWLQRAVQVFLS